METYRVPEEDSSNGMGIFQSLMNEGVRRFRKGETISEIAIDVRDYMTLVANLRNMNESALDFNYVSFDSAAPILKVNFGLGPILIHAVNDPE